MNAQKVLYTLVDKEFNVKNTFDRSTALAWISPYYNRKGSRVTRSVLFDMLPPTGLGTVYLYDDTDIDSRWVCKLIRSQISLD